uniref:Casein alpha s2-like A n=1 Tax=Rattus norvegicus TaxID=10116 RepID=A0ABK0LK84_RAT
MKFFIFTCLVAAALAKHAVKDKPSSEGSASVYLGKYKQGNGVFFQTPQDSASSSSSEESSEEISEKKSKQFSQDSSFPQICTPYQQQSSVNQWPQPNAIYNIPSQESTSTSVEEILKKIIDIVKYFQYQQLTNPHFPQAVHPQIPVSSWAPSKDYTFPTARYMRSY